MSEFDSQILYSKETIKRLVSDIKQLKKNSLELQGIYYNHDEENVLKGYAMIIGPENTPYSYGHYFFVFDYPNNYPHSPPKVTFHNYGDNIRFNPNLYRNGKVCLSVLNTWKGEGWTSCQTITTILLTLCTVFNDYPLLNEPGITMQQKEAVENYNKIISYKNIELAFLKCFINFHLLPEHFKFFLPVVRENVEKNTNNIKENIENITKEYLIRESVVSQHYNMNIIMESKKIKSLLNELNKKLNKKLKNNIK